MADYAANYTARLRVKYTSGGVSHSFTVRAPHAVLALRGPVFARTQAFLNEVAPFLNADWTVTGAEWADRDSDVFLPVIGISTPTGKSAVVSEKGRVPSFMSFVGRSTGGSRTRVTLFGTTLMADSDGGGDYRFSAGESADLANVISVLNTSSDLGGIDGGAALWYGYVNIGYNAHWQRAQRG